MTAPTSEPGPAAREVPAPAPATPSERPDGGPVEVAITGVGGRRDVDITAEALVAIGITIATAGLPSPVSITPPGRHRPRAELQWPRGETAAVDAWAEHLGVTAGVLHTVGHGRDAWLEYGAEAELCGHPVYLWCRRDDRTCSDPGDPEHDHAPCEDVVAEEREAQGGEPR